MSARLPAGLQAIAADYLRREFGDVDYPWRLPVTSVYGPRVNPVDGEYKNHDGIDIAIRTGTPILAIYDGTIERIDYDTPINGTAVFLRCGLWLFAYLHLSAVRVSIGQTVTAGDILGASGSSGRSTGPHLHFQAYFAGFIVDPAILFPGDLFFRV